MMKHFLILSLTLLPLCLLAQSERIFQQWDKNKDGFLTKDEVPSGPKQIFDRKDKNGDGKVSLEEHLGKSPKKPTVSKPTQSEATFTIPQSWSQEPDGFDRPVYVAETELGERKKAPVLIYLHGGGGRADRSLKNYSKQYPNHLVVAPQGYLNYWNVHGEKSKAPDVSFFEKVIEEIGKRYNYADMEQVSVIGSSNGAAYIYRLLIEAKPGLFQTAVPTVSSLMEIQHREGSFWKSADESNTEKLDQRVPQLTHQPRLLYIHGKSDQVVPFEGGLRFKKYPHHSAQVTANLLAKGMGHTGKQPSAVEIQKGLFYQAYPGTKQAFGFIAVEDGNHGLAPHRDVVSQVIKKFIEGKSIAP